MNKHLLAVLLTAAMFISPAAFAAGKTADKATEKVSYLQNIAAEDMPGDAGGAAVITWDVPENAPEDIIYRVYATADDPENKASWKQIAEFSAADKTITANNIKLPFWIWKKGESQYAVKVNGDGLQARESASMLLTAANLDNMQKLLSEQSAALKDSNPELYKETAAIAAKYSAVSAELKKSAAEIMHKTDHDVFCKVEVLKKNKVIETSEQLQTVMKSNWFRADRVNTLFMTFLIIAVFLYSLSRAKKGQSFIRRINGLDAIEEAVGRATEMGKPIFYTTGLYDIEAISTIASVFVLGEVAKKVAAYDCGLVVPHKQFLTMSVCRAVTKEAYAEAGRSDSYKEDSNFFLNPDQFAYATGVEAIITREKPAACFYMGSFAAEALLMSEVGTTVGAIQVAGTDSEDQLPFFFTSCDYTLIGEELYAAGAYLSKDPLLVSALKVQDFGKLLFMVLSITAVILVLISVKTGNMSLQKGVLDLLTGY